MALDLNFYILLKHTSEIASNFVLMFKSVIIYFLIILGHAPKHDVGKAESIMSGQIMPYTVKE